MRRSRIAVAVACTLAIVCATAACSSDDDAPAEPACDACAKNYASCSLPGNPEALAFEITSHQQAGCTANLQGAEVRISCEPLTFCFPSTGNCSAAQYAEGVLRWGPGDNACS